MGVRSPHEEASSGNDDTGMVPVLPSQQEYLLSNRKLRPSQSMHCIRPNKPHAVRNSSISTALSKLSLEDPFEPQGHQVMLNSMGPPPFKSKAKLQGTYVVTAERRSQDLRSDHSLSLFQENKVRSEGPITPSHIPIRPKAEANNFNLETPCKIPLKSHTKSISLQSPYLNKASNLTNFTEWDVRERIERMEDMYKNLQNNLQSSVSERQSYDQEQALIKARGR
jgi:hypothetical protein